MRERQRGREVERERGSEGERWRGVSAHQVMVGQVVISREVIAEKWSFTSNTHIADAALQLSMRLHLSHLPARLRLLPLFPQS